MQFEGVVSVLKPPGMTSSDVVVDIRRIFGERRVGHTGTLDPAAAGVLPICIGRDRKSTRLNSSHDDISYAVFCLKKFFFNDTATTEIYTLSLHDALPILMFLSMNLMELLRKAASFFSTSVQLISFSI